MAELELMSESQRLAWLQGFTEYFGLSWFESIKGVLAAGAMINGPQGFRGAGLQSLMLQSSMAWQRVWVSSGVVSGRSTNPGAALWASFFRSYYKGRSEGQLKHLWATADSVTTHFGAALAESRGLRANQGEMAVIDFSDFWRSTMLQGTSQTTISPAQSFLYGTAPELFDPRMDMFVTSMTVTRVYLGPYG